MHLFSWHGDNHTPSSMETLDVYSSHGISHDMSTNVVFETSLCALESQNTCGCPNAPVEDAERMGTR
jgi:hypothetical protein